MEEAKGKKQVRKNIEHGGKIKKCIEAKARSKREKEGD